MFKLSGSEVLFYGGLAVMCISVLLAAICTTALKISGKRLRKKLDLEYGKPYR